MSSFVVAVFCFIGGGEVGAAAAAGMAQSQKNLKSNAERQRRTGTLVFML